MAFPCHTHLVDNYLGFYTRFFLRKIGYFKFRTKVGPSSVCTSFRPSVTFLVIVSYPKPLDEATSNYKEA